MSLESSTGQTNTIEKIDDVSRKAVISISEERVAKEYQSALDKLQRTAQIKGFRPGKAPRQMIEKMHGSRLQIEVTHDLIQKSWEAVLQEMKEKVIGAPDIKLDTFEPGKAISYTANFSVFPEPDIKGYENFDLKITKLEPKQEDLDKILNNILKSKATPKPLGDDRKIVADGDVVSAVLTELIDGQPGEKKEPFTLPLGDGMLPAELEQALVGMEVGSEKAVFMPFGASAKTASADAPNFLLKVESISIRELPELTDELVKSLGFEKIETALELKADIRKRLEEELAERMQQDVDLAITDKLLDLNKFQVPDILLKDEIRSLVAKSGVADQQAVESEDFDIEPYREQYTVQAEKRVRYTILIDRIAEIENLKAEKTELENYCQKMSDQHQLPIESVKGYFLGKDRYLATFLTVTRDKVLGFLRTRAKVDYQPAHTA